MEQVDELNELEAFERELLAELEDECGPLQVERPWLVGESFSKGNSDARFFGG